MQIVNRKAKLLGIVLLILSTIGQAVAQSPRDTSYSPDQALKSNARVNPSTFAMELTIPVGGYPGRNGTSLPVAFIYSSKVWEMKHLASWESPILGVKTGVGPTFGKRSAAGWTSTLGTAAIDYKFTWYREGDPNLGDSYPGVMYAPELWQEDPSVLIYYVKRLQVTLPDGSSHEFLTYDPPINCGTINGGCDNINRSGTYYSVDGTKMRLEVSDTNPTILFLPNGDRYIFPSFAYSSRYDMPPSEAHTFIDRSGNKMTYNTSTRTWTDTLGRSLTSPFEWNWNGGTNQTEGVTTAEFPGLANADQEIDLVWWHLKDPDGSNHALEDPQATLHNLSDKFCQGNLEHSVTGPYLFGNTSIYTRICGPGFTTQGPPFNPVVLAGIELPNGQSYQFRYNVYGEITKIIYPSGGYERFQYAEITPLQYADGAYNRAVRGVVKQWVSASGEGSDEVLTEYSVERLGSIYSPYNKITIEDPDGSYSEKYVFAEPHDEPRPFGYSRMLSGMPFEERTYSSDSPTQILTKVLTEYDSTIIQAGLYTGHLTAPVNVRTVRTILITFEPGNSQALASMTETVYDTGGSGDPAYFSALNPVQQKTYGYVAVNASTAASANIATAAAWFSNETPAAVAETDYLYDSNYKARNINGIVTETRIKDGAGNVKAKTQISYDEGAYQLSSTGTMPGAASGSWLDPVTELGGTVGAKRGLATSVKSYHDITNSLYMETHTFYDQFGNVRKVRDGRGNDTETLYDDDYAFAYPTSVVTAVPDSSGTYGSNTAFTTSVTYDYNTGLTLTATDANGAVTEMEYDDPLLRPTKVTTAVGTALEAETVTEYGAGTSAPTRWAKVRTQIDSTNWKEARSWFDGIGRNILSQSVDNGQDDVFVVTCYDEMGRVAKTSNPVRASTAPTCASSLEWTTPAYDDLGRVTAVTTPDGAVVETAYSLATSGSQIGTVVTVEDQAGKLRRSITNALGQLIRVDEPDDSSSTGSLGTISSPNQATLYAYDTLNNLTTVTQGVQTRTFSYDALSRLKDATNPESGTIKYTYDNNGNLKTKWDARGIKTIYDYDTLNRVWKRCYKSVGTSSLGYTTCATASGETTEPNTPDVTYYYDNIANGKGKLKKVASTVSTTEYTSFDILGRVTGHKQTTNGEEYETEYVYNLSGALIEQTYPSGRVVKNVLDNNGDLSIVQSRKDENHGYWNYASSFTYNAARAVTSMQLGNGRWESTQFNSRLQPTQIALGTVQNGTDKLKLEYGYGTTQNNENVLSQTITVPTVGINPGFTAVQSYTYDSLNRISTAEETISSVQSWKQAFTYDRYGNRNFDEEETTTLPKNCGSSPNFTVCAADKKIVNPAINTTNNRLSAGDDYTYDAAGNTTQDAQGRAFIYDGENKQTEVKDQYGNTIGEYFYDGHGKRVKKYTASSNELTIFVYDAIGRLLGEYSTIQPVTPKVSYTTADHLGSSRILTDENGEIISRRDFHPFGEEIVSTDRLAALGYKGDDVRQKFTGYERDEETDLDFAQARYHDSSAGRFYSTDPILMNNKRIVDPQAMNAYVYVRNSPLRFVDPDGREFRDEKGNVIEVFAVQGFLFLSCPKCAKDSEQLANLQMLVDATNATWNTDAYNAILGMHYSKTIFHIDFSNEDPLENNRGRSVHRPHTAQDGNGQSRALWWKWSDGHMGKGFFDGVPDVQGEGDDIYYRESTITFHINAFKDKGINFVAELLKDLVHESSHGLDKSQVRAARDGVRSVITTNTIYDPYHPTYMYDTDNRVRKSVIANGFQKAGEYYITQQLVSDYFNGRSGCWAPDF